MHRYQQGSCHNEPWSFLRTTALHELSEQFLLDMKARGEGFKRIQTRAESLLPHSRSARPLPQPCPGQHSYEKKPLLEREENAEERSVCSDRNFRRSHAARRNGVMSAGSLRGQIACEKQRFIDRESDAAKAMYTKCCERCQSSGLYRAWFPWLSS